MLNLVKRIAVSAFTAQCILRVYHGPNESAFIDDGSGTGQLRPQTNSECVGAAITQGATLAEGTITAIRNDWNGWNGANEQTRQERVDNMRKWLRGLPEDWQNVLNDMAQRRAKRNGHA